MPKTVTIDSRNHHGASDKNGITHYVGYYLVNGEKIDDTGNSSSNDAELIRSVLPKAIEILGLEDVDEIDLFEIVMEDCGNIDEDPSLIEITGTCYDDLKVKNVEGKRVEEDACSCCGSGLNTLTKCVCGVWLCQDCKDVHLCDEY